jgi:hypothetical protein
MESANQNTPFSGGPEASVTAPVEVLPPESTAPVAPAQPASQQVYIGGRLFNSTQEALEYADQAAKRAQDAEAALARANQQTREAAEVDPADILFEDPKAAMRLAEQRILNQVDARAAAQKQERDVWSGFYADYPDLKGFEEIVDLNKSKNWEALKNLPLDQSLPRLAKEARGHLAKIRGAQNTSTQQLSSAPATVMGGTGGIGTGAAKTVQTAPKTFVQELNEAKLARRKIG